MQRGVKDLPATGVLFGRMAHQQRGDAVTLDRAFVTQTLRAGGVRHAAKTGQPPCLGQFGNGRQLVAHAAVKPLKKQVIADPRQIVIKSRPSNCRDTCERRVGSAVLGRIAQHGDLLARRLGCDQRCGRQQRRHIGCSLGVMLLDIARQIGCGSEPELDPAARRIADTAEFAKKIA